MFPHLTGKAYFITDDEQVNDNGKGSGKISYVDEVYNYLIES